MDQGLSEENCGDRDDVFRSEAELSTWDGRPPPGAASDTPHWLRGPSGYLHWAWWDGANFRLSYGGFELVLGPPLIRERLSAHGWRYLGPTR
jgi:hypothetical protein